MLGTYSCAGKALALMEIRRVVAALLSKYDVSIAPDQGVEDFLSKQKDTFTLVNPALKLVFKNRGNLPS